jgi:hypothetical protein
MPAPPTECRYHVASAASVRERADARPRLTPSIMATRKDPTAAARSAAKATARKTASAPAHPSAAPTTDALVAKAADTNALVASIPINTNKPGEFGHDNAVNPPTGFTVDAASPDVGSSTLTEINANDKTGAAADPGVDNTPARWRTSASTTPAGC